MKYLQNLREVLWIKIVELVCCIERKKNRGKNVKKYNSLRTSFKHSKDHKCCQSSAKRNLVVSGLLSMDTRIEFQRLRGENYYCYLVDTYLVNKVMHKFSKAVFERLDLKERIFLRQFLNCPTKWNISSVVQTIINGLTSRKYFIHEGKFHCLLLKQLCCVACVTESWSILAKFWGVCDSWRGGDSLKE